MPIETRIRYAAENILGDASVTGELMDAEAQSLLSWGLSLSERIARSTEMMDDRRALPLIEESLATLRRTMRQIGKFVGNLERIDFKTGQETLGKALQAAEDLPGIRVHSPSSLQAEFENLRSMSAGSALERILAWLEQEEREAVVQPPPASQEVPTTQEQMSMSQATTRMRQAVDWSAALWAGVISGVLFLVVNVLLTAYSLGSPWIIIRILASVVMGSAVLPPPASFDVTILIVALVVHLVLSVLFASVLAIIIHRWGLIVGIVGGAVFGLALYAINFYTFSFLFPWFFVFKSWMMVVSHVVFGAAAGGIYELLEVEEFVPARE